jgi:hypothetical protein
MAELALAIACLIVWSKRFVPAPYHLADCFKLRTGWPTLKDVSQPDNRLGTALIDLAHLLDLFAALDGVFLVDAQCVHPYNLGQPPVSNVFQCQAQVVANVDGSAVAE